VRGRRLAAVVATVACLAAAAPAAADWQVVGGGPVATGGSSLSLGVYGFRTYDMKRIGGRLYVAWGQDWKVHVARLAEDRSAWEAVGGIVNGDHAHRAHEPSLAAAPDGTPWITWAEQDRIDAWQIRAARFDADRDQWVQPDGRDWTINELPEGYDPDPVFSGSGPRLTFLGARPYIAYLQDNPSEFNLQVVRLAAGGHSWERVARGLGSSIPRDDDAAVIGGLLHVGLTGGFEHPAAIRLNQDGAWSELGGGAVNDDVLDEYSYPRSGFFKRIAGFQGEPYVLWNATVSGSYGESTYVSHVVNGKWQIVGGNIGDGTGGASLRAIGGRLYAAWVEGPDSPDLRLSRLADDRASWVATPGIAGMPADNGAVLSSLDGVPYVAWIRTDGATNELVIQRLDGAPEPLAPDEDEGSGSGTDPDVDATPIVPPADDPPTPAPSGPCAEKMRGTFGPDRLAAGARGTTIRGRAGDDRELGGPRRDCLFGDAGSDVLRGRDGEDRLYGGRGGDQIFGGPDEDALTGGPGPDELRGGAGWDVFRGGPGDDTILAADGRGEKVWCGPGIDTARIDRHDHPHGCEHVQVAKR
jgi:hypothetical protein